MALATRRDPDNVAFCVLAADEEDEGDIALQIHFTLIQAFCCENDIDIVRVSDLPKLAAAVGSSEESGEPRDLHCILIMVRGWDWEGWSAMSGQCFCNKGFSSTHYGDSSAPCSLCLKMLCFLS